MGAKAALRLLVKMTPWVNFTNILRAAFLYACFEAAVFFLHLRYVLFWRKNRVWAQKLLLDYW